MKTNLLLLLGIVAVIMVLTIFLNSPSTPVFKSVPVDTIQKVPDFPLSPNPLLKSIDGKEFYLHDLKGKTVLVNFWASWCAPCLVEFPQLLALVAREDITLVAISVDAEKENITRFINELDKISQQSLMLPNVHIIHDPEKSIAQETFQTIRYPETLLIAPDMTLRHKIIGADTDFAAESFRTFVQETTRIGH
jgi:thiol-disulfide isomerase/thioredoxin